MTQVLVFLLTVISLGLLLTIYLYLLCRKWLNQRRRNKKERWLKVQSHDIDIYLFTGYGAESFVPEKEYQYEALEDTFSDFLSNVKFEKDFGPINAYVERYFAPWYRKRLRSRSWSVRMNTLYFINRFNMDTMQNDLVRHLSSKQCSAEEKLEILLILADFEYKALLELMKDVKELPTFSLNELWSRLVSQDNVDTYVDGFFEYDGSWQGAFLEAVRDKHLRSEKLQQLLEQLIESEQRELRVKALKTIGSLGYMSSVDTFIQWLESNEAKGIWDHPQATGEKLMAARLMGSIRHDRFIPYLKKLIGDKAYGVRAEAARALRQYRQGKSMLTKLAYNHPDAFARSIAQEWIERSPDYYE
ncbi:HEAT repeat domain-containing protein [Bacillus sp. 3255]|uniref:HEAT repeat domain-containing protein n=1 Tax=Bacillus sp. 3255 TaxID=2817904 RepID=UPI00285CF2B8|nr:HEAT repeat domain-containing protein [Bacillus sp. 3255]MDR6879348.1 hypothetical protein [Bacillus sp. 3255]